MIMFNYHITYHPLLLTLSNSHNLSFLHCTDQTSIPPVKTKKFFATAKQCLEQAEVLFNEALSEGRPFKSLVPPTSLHQSVSSSAQATVPVSTPQQPCGPVRPPATSPNATASAASLPNRSMSMPQSIQRKQNNSIK